jgi:disulfide bond formation protein DsbB
MTVATRAFPTFVLAASAVVLGAALLSQYWGGLAPCELCLLQPWVAALLAAVFAVSVAFAFYHVGVERHWFAGPSACSGAATAADTVEALKAQILRQHPVRCDEVAWALWGVSLAGWNLLASAVMLGCCLVTFAQARRPLRRTRLRRGTA